MKIPQPPPDLDSLFTQLFTENSDDVMRRVLASQTPLDPDGRYLHWDEMRYREPPDGLTHEEWWLRTRMGRGALKRPVPLRGVDGNPFSICMVDPLLRALHTIDQSAAGEVLADEPLVARGNRDRYIVRSLIEEAVASSQLEGASTTRADAKRMLLEKRQPRDRSEQMIFNNFSAMNAVRELVRSEEPLTVASIRYLHRVLTTDTLDDPADAGRVQTPDEQRVAVFWPDGTSNERRVHVPPPAGELPERLEAMCAFANGEHDDGFVHPVVRAVVLHFWLAHDHSFVDGNGRLARSLFYWSMLSSNYWLTEFLTVSSILRQAPALYARSFLLTETDGNDLTYFVLYQVGVIERAIEAFREYLRAKQTEVSEVEALLSGRPGINHRQRDVLAIALRDSNCAFVIAGHQNKHGVTYQTARTDLLDLVSRGFLMKIRDGRSFRFMPAPDLTDRVRAPESACS